MNKSSKQDPLLDGMRMGTTHQEQDASKIIMTSDGHQSLSALNMNASSLFSAYEIKPKLHKNRFVLSVLLHGAALIVLVQVPGWLSTPKLQPLTYARVTPLVAPVPPAIVRK